MKKVLKKVLVYLSVIAIVVQSLSPLAYLSLNSKAYAQTATDDATTVSPTPTPTDTVTPTPTDTVTPTPTDTPVPIDTVTPTVTPTPIDTVTPTPTPVDNLSPPTTDTSTQVQGDSTTPTPEPIVSPTPAPTQNPKDEQLNLVILNNVSAPSIDLGATAESGSAVLITDKPDYAPTDTALITGSSLLPNTTYTLRVWSDDQPPTGVSAQVTSDANGVFAYAYQLDGTYRPNYSAELRDSAGTVVATVTFTDSGPVENVADLAQLQAALADPAVTTINITANITGITSSVVVGHAVTINGGGNTLGFTGLEAASGGVDDGLLIQAPATINNLIVNAGLSVPTTWAGTYAIHVYNTSATLNDVTATNGNGGILVNGSAVTLTGITTVSGNGFGGIEVSASIPNSLPDSILTVTGTLVNSTEAYGKPTIWLINEQGTVTGANVPTTTSTTIVAGQTQYYLTAGNAVNPIACISDAQGVNDQPNQKDLTKMCADYSSSTSVGINWNWDEINGSGGNTFDACSLYDTDSDGLANYSVCVTVTGSPLVQAASSPRIYSCNDANSDKCLGNVLIAGSYATNCSVTQQNNDPFPTGDAYPNDTVASCTVTLSEVGGSSSKLLDVCSYPSQQPNSAPSDCIIASTAAQTGTVELKKVWSGTPGQTTLNIGTTANGTEIASVQTGVDGGTPLTTGTKIVSTGTYYVSETGGLTNYTPSLSCTKNGNSVTPGTNNSLTVGNNDVFICTFTNTRINNASITIIKDAIPNDAQDFAFTTTGSGLSNFSLDDDGDNNNTLSNTKVFSNLAAGAYSVAENGVTGWTSDGGVCSDGSPVSAIDLFAGENVTCTFTNTKQATVTVVKNTTGGNDTFGFATTGGNGLDSSFNLTTVSNTDSKSFTVTPGISYSVSEDSKSGWDLTSSSCTSGTPASFTPSAGQTITCTFNNTKKGHLIVQKTTVPGADQTVFTINATGNGTITNGGAGTVTDATDKDYEVTPGTYSVAETVPTGWSKTGDTCQNVAVGAGQTVYCLLTNTKLGSITVVKNTNFGDSTFLFSTTGGLDPVNFNITTSGGTGSKLYSDVLPGNYSITENTPASWVQGTIECIDGTTPIGGVVDSTASFTLTAGHNIVCTFNNTGQGQLKIVKNTVGGNDTFGFTVTGSTPLTPNILTSGGTGNTGFITVNTGNYSVSETTVPSDWTPTGASCTNGQASLVPTSFNINAGDSVTCTFENTRDTGTVVVYKDVQGPNGEDITDSANFQVSLDSGTGQAITDNLTVTYNNVPVGNHTITESFINSGYTLYGISQTPGQSGNTGGLTINVTTGTNNVYVTNRQQSGTITVIKDVVNPNGGPVSDSHTFTVNLSPGTQSSPFAEGSNAVFTVDPGTYTASEDIDSAYTSLGCLTATEKTDIVVDSGKNVTITCTNKQNTGTVVVYKDVQGPNGENVTDASNSFQVSLNGGTGQIISDNLTVTYNNVLVGSHTITESLVDSDYTLYGISQTPGQSGNTGGLTINVTTGTNNVYVTNRQKSGTITVIKDVVNPDGGVASDTHAFTVNLTPGDQSDTFAEGDNAVFTVNPGTYTASENDDTNYDELGCKTATEKDDIVVGSGESVTITCTNRQKKATITIHKNVINPDNEDVSDSHSFTVQRDSGDSKPIAEGTDAVYTVNPGTYIFTENSDSSYTLDSITGDNDSDATNGASVTVGNNGTAELTFINKQKTGTITGTKWNDLNGNEIRDCELFDGFSSQSEFCEYTEPVLGDWTIELLQSGEGWEKINETATDENGNYQFTVNPGTYRVCEIIPTGWNQTYPINSENEDSCYDITVGLGDELSNYNFGNHQNKLTIYKYDQDDEYLGGATFRVCPEKTGDCFNITDNGEGDINNENGIIEILGLANDYYYVTETQAPKGYQLDQENSCTRSLNSESTDVSCEFYNQRITTPILTIAKTNDAVGNKAPGDTVGFTITVKADSEGGPADNVKVIDLLPSGFVFNSSSWNVVSSDTTRGIDGNITSLLTAPTYASPGTWNLGHMNSGETLTLTYTATINTSQQAGTYYDNAWAQGTAVEDSTILLASAVGQPGQLDDNFVGTEVKIVINNQSGSYNTTVTKEVLGAETYLPATGENTLWVIIATIFSGLGLGSLLLGLKLRRRYVK